MDYYWLEDMPRTTQEVIDQAIRENRRWEFLLLCFAALFVALGAAAIIWSIIKREPISGVAGAIESALFWPAWNLASRTRKDNIMLRMLEVPLSKATTSTEAAEMLQRVFETHFLQVPAGKEEKAAKA
jgi:hypothetical protein